MEITQPVVKWGNSHGIRIPKKMLDELGINEKDYLNISLEANSIVMKPVQKKARSIKELFEDFYQMDFDKAIEKYPYDFEEVDCGKPVGDEIW